MWRRVALLLVISATFIVTVVALRHTTAVTGLLSRVGLASSHRLTQPAMRGTAQPSSPHVQQDAPRFVVPSVVDTTMQFSPSPSSPGTPAPAVAFSSEAGSVASTYWVRGVVVTPDRRPVERFTIQLFSRFGPMAQPEYTKQFDTPTGEFEVAWSDPGPADMVAKASGFTGGMVNQVLLASSRDQAERWEIALIPGGKIQGVVLNEAGQPVVGATVELGQYLYEIQIPNPPMGMSPAEVHALIEAAAKAQNPNPWRLSDDLGHFELTDLPQGAYSLYAEHPDYFPTAQHVTIQPGGVYEGVRLILSNRGGTILAHVMDLEGNPIAGRSVSIEEGRIHGLTDRQGLWRAENLRPGEYQVVLAAEETDGIGAAWRWATINVAAGHESLVTFQLAPGVLISGEVSWAGQPLGDVEVTASQSNSLQLPGSESVPPSSAVASARADRHGRFELAGLPPGGYQLMVAHGEDTATLEVALAPSDRHRFFQIRFGTGQVEGVIRDGGTGQPIAHASARLLLTRPIQDEREDDDVFYASPERDVVTDQAGRYRIDHVAFGRYLLEVNSGTYGNVSQPIEVSGAITRHDVALWPGGQLVMTVTNSKRFPFHHAMVTIAPVASPDNSLAALTDSQGTVLLTHLAPGAYEVLVGAGSDPASFRTTVNIRPAQLERLAVTLDTDATQGEDDPATLRSTSTPPR